MAPPFKKLRAAYDSHADVLYVDVGAAVAVEGDGLPGGVELDFSQEEGNPVGVTIVGYVRNKWPQKRTELAGIVSQHLRVNRSTAIRALRKVTETT